MPPLVNVQFTRFTRMMRRWGFAMERVGRNEGTYQHHPLFIRTEIQIVKKVRPKKRDDELPVALVQPIINAH